MSRTSSAITHLCLGLGATNLALACASPIVCPDGTAGTTVRGRFLSVPSPPNPPDNERADVGVTLGSPVRGFQVEELSLYLVGADYWLGRRTAGRGGSWTAVRPLVGPLTANGLSFSYFDVAGAVPAFTTGIASIGLTIRGRSTQLVSGTGYMEDSIVTRVTLRNNARF